jgi:hypothetical protein
LTVDQPAPFLGGRSPEAVLFWEFLSAVVDVCEGVSAGGVALHDDLVDDNVGPGMRVSTILGFGRHSVRNYEADVL